MLDIDYCLTGRFSLSLALSLPLFVSLGIGICLILVNVAAQNPTVRDERRIVTWEHFDPALCRWLSKATGQVVEAVALFDRVTVFAVDVSSRMFDYQ